MKEGENIPVLTLVRGDQNYLLEFEVKDADGEIVDITGCSLGFKMQKYGESTLTLDKAGSIITGTLGLCQVLIEDELIDKSGEFYAELEIRWSGLNPKILTCPDIYVKILKDLPR